MQLGDGKEENKMKLHYFNQETADIDDVKLIMAKNQGYVPETCLLSGIVVMDEINKCKSPCDGCAGPRDKCYGSPKRNSYFGKGVK